MFFRNPYFNAMLNAYFTRSALNSSRDRLVKARQYADMHAYTYILQMSFLSEKKTIVFYVYGAETSSSPIFIISFQRVVVLMP